MAAIRILYPDVRSVDDFAFERAVVPEAVDLIHYDAAEASAIPDDVWGDADALVTGIGMPIDNAVFERAPGCRIITRLGVGYDLRKARPYSVYNRFQFDVPTGENGDTYDRYLVRMEEMRQSLRIIEQALDTLPEGPIRAKVPNWLKPPKGEVYHSVESPRGEQGFYIVSNGTDKPYRMRFRGPSFANLQALPQLCKGHLVADVVALIGTLDIVLGDVDR